MKAINERAFMNLIKEERYKLIAVLFTQKDCDKTEQIMPKLEEFSQSAEFKNVIFCSVFLETETSLFKANNIRGTPTIVFYRQKNEVGRITGADEFQIEEALRSLCPKDFVGTARKITPAQNQSFDYLEQIAHSKPSLLKDPTGYKPKEKAKPSPSKVAPKVEKIDDFKEEEEEEENNEAEEKEKFDNLLEDLKLLVDDVDEEIIKKAIEYYGTSVDTEEMEELCKRAADDDWDSSKKFIKKNKFTKGLTNEQISNAEFLIENSFNPVDSYCIVKELSDIGDCMEKLSDWQESRLFISELGEEAVEALDMLLPVFGFTKSFDYFTDGEVITKDTAKKIIREHKRTEKEKEKVKNQLKKMMKPKASQGPFTSGFELTEEEKKREMWEREEAIRDAKRIKAEIHAKEIARAEIARKVKEQRMHNKIEDEMNLKQPKIAAPAKPKNEGTKGKCKVILFHENKPNTIILCSSNTVDDLITKWAAAARTDKDTEYQLIDPATNKAIECTRETKLSEIGIFDNSVARFNIFVKFSE